MLGRLSLWLAASVCMVAAALAQTEPADRKPLLGVCVTGQLKRMEFWSKVHNLIVPNMHHYDINLLFVLDFEANEAVNEQFTLGTPAHVMTTAEIADNVQRYCPRCAIIVEDYVQPSSPMTVARYIAEQRKFSSTEKRQQRATIHARIFTSWATCYRGFQRFENKQHDVFLRIREDLYIPYNFFITRDQWSGAVGVQTACGYHGYNDKAAVLDARFGFQYFVGPIVNMDSYHAEMRNQSLIINSETILRASLTWDNVTVKVLTPEQLPFLVTRPRADGSLCFADSYAKTGPRFSCIPAPARALWRKYRCGSAASLQDVDGFDPLIAQEQPQISQT